MKSNLKIKSLGTKVGQRIFLLFILCAVMPIAALAWVSFFVVEEHLIDQSNMRMQQETKAMALALSEQLSLLEASMRLVASNFNSFLIAPKRILHRALLEDIQERFKGLVVFTDREDVSTLSGRIGSPPALTLAEKRHLSEGHVLLSVPSWEAQAAALFLFTYMDPARGDMGTLVGEVRMDDLEKVAEARSPETDLTVLDRDGRILFSTFFTGSAVPPSFLQEARVQKKGLYEWTHEGEPYMVSRLSLPLRTRFHYPEWSVVLTASKKSLLAPIDRFKRSFPVVIALSLGMVFVLSLMLIRKNLTPIEVLKEATRRIAEGETGYETVIKSGDEFEELGSAFNRMSTRLQETQEMLVRGQKLSTMGEMAAGMIHEIKQPLTAIQGLLEISMLSESLPDNAKEPLKTAMKAVKRLNLILQKFGSFSYAAPEKMEPLNLQAVMDRVHELMVHQMEMKRIRCFREDEEALPAVHGDGHALEQVFSNLLMNAIHALEERKDQRRIDMRTFSRDGRILVEIQDNGSGIPPDVQEKIFTPFFTTKGEKRGTGLGMAIVESILHKHQAKIELESEVGEGTTFRIVFPPCPPA